MPACAHPSSQPPPLQAARHGSVQSDRHPYSAFPEFGGTSFDYIAACERKREEENEGVRLAPPLRSPSRCEAEDRAFGVRSVNGLRHFAVAELVLAPAAARGTGRCGRLSRRTGGTAAVPAPAEQPPPPPATPSSSAASASATEPGRIPRAVPAPARHGARLPARCAFRCRSISSRVWIFTLIRKRTTSARTRSSSKPNSSKASRLYSCLGCFWA